MKVSLKIISAALSLLIAGCGLPPAPANMPPPIPASELRPTSADPYSTIITPVSEPLLATGAVVQGEDLLTIPYTYRHTAVLTQDVEGYSITVSGTRLQAGAPGYFAGNFGSMGMSGQTGRVTDMWCFFRENEVAEERDPLCLLRDESGVAAVAPTRMSPYLWTSFSPMTGSFDYVHTPIFVRQEVAMPVDLALEYRFDGWRDGQPQVEVFIRGDRVQTLPGRAEADGSFVLDTIAGTLVISRDEESENSVRAALR